MFSEFRARSMSTGDSPSISETLIRLSESIRETLASTPYTPPDGPNISIKSNLQRLLPKNPREDIRGEIRDFCLCCAALASAAGADSDPISWVSSPLSAMAESAVRELSQAVYDSSEVVPLIGVGDYDADFSSAPNESRLVAELMPDVLPLLKKVIKESSIDSEEDEITAASARAPVAEAIVAVQQFRWFVAKRQGMVSLIHVAKNVNAAELGCYGDVLLDASCRNIASSDELWHDVVEMSVLLLTCLQRSNPRSSWYEKIVSEMLGHLERQPRSKERRIVWLQLIEPVFNAMGLILLVHFRRIFPLLFMWMHANDDETVLLVLDRVHTIIKLTWIRNSPYIERLVDELTLIFKESALRKGREAIRSHVLQILLSLQQCKGPHFGATWEKHKDDPDLSALTSTLGKDAISDRLWASSEV